MARYEATITIRWYHELVRKTPDAELGAIIAHNAELLKSEGMVVMSKDIKQLTNNTNKAARVGRKR